ncbi:7381_t:CDS:2, partial [Racocetra persica]
NTQLTYFEKGQIIGMYNVGSTLASIAEVIGCVCATVSKFLERGCVIAKKPGLTPRQAELRLAWYNAHTNWNISDWQKVIFSDESSVEIGGCLRRSFVWRKNKSHYEPYNTMPTFRSGRRSIMVWECFAGGEKGPL